MGLIYFFLKKKKRGEYLIEIVQIPPPKETPIGLCARFHHKWNQKWSFRQNHYQEALASSLTLFTEMSLILLHSADSSL